MKPVEYNARSRTSPLFWYPYERTREAPGFAGLYPVGEGAGYAGGIVSAGVDVLKTAMAIVASYSPIG